MGLVELYLPLANLHGSVKQVVDPQKNFGVVSGLLLRFLLQRLLLTSRCQHRFILDVQLLRDLCRFAVQLNLLLLALLDVVLVFLLFQLLLLLYLL